jgi:hypothetical protein
LNIDIKHIGERKMTRTFNNSMAMVAALLLTLVTFQQAITVPVDTPASIVELA